MDDKIFIYEGKEWVLTGRTATRPVFHKVKKNQKMGMMTIVEIAPNGPSGSDPTFHKWVDPRELYYVKEEVPEDIDIDLLNDMIGQVSGESDE